MPFFVPGAGYLALTDVNRVLGSDAGDANTGDNVFLAMANAGQNNTGDRVIAIGVLAGANNAIDDLIAIGENSGGGAGAGLLQGSNICIGNNALQSGVDATRNVVIGHAAAELVVIASAADFTDNVVLGDRVLANMTDAVGTLNLSVIIGSQAGENLGSALGGFGGNVIIGRRAAQGPGAVVEIAPLNNVIIGEQAALRIRTAISNVIIGRLAGQDITTGVGNVLIGLLAGENLTTGGQNVMLGLSAGAIFAGADVDNVLVGDAAGSLGRQGDRNIIIGRDAQLGPNGVGDDNIVIGARANSPSFAGSRNMSENLLIETVTTGSRKTYMLAVAQAGNASFILGNNNAGSGVGTAEDLTALIAGGAVNILKLVDGADAGATNPVAGGYFYVSAGTLHWVGSAGTDTTVAAA